MFGVIGEGLFEGLVSTADGHLQEFSDTLLAANQRQASEANARAELARKETETIRRETSGYNERIATAHKDAAEAALATETIKKRNLELEAEVLKMKIPRSLEHIPELASKMRRFKGSEYKFASVFGDDESINLLEQIQKMLQLAGWSRVKSDVLNIGIPAVRYKGEKNDLINIGIRVGVHIEVDSPESLDTIRSLPEDKWPEIVRKAVSLNSEILSEILPHRTFTDDDRVEMTAGSSQVIRIHVGRKP